MHARTMGYKAIFTDHSLFGFADTACIHMNKVLKFFISDIGKNISELLAKNKTLFKYFFSFS